MSGVMITKYLSKEKLSTNYNTITLYDSLSVTIIS